MLSEKIKTLRSQKGLSQEELGNRLAVVRQTVSKWEKGLSVPDSAMLVRIAQVLDVSVPDLLSQEVECPIQAKKEAAEMEIDPPHTPAKRSTAGVVLIILGSPVWLPLAISAGAVVLAIYLSCWAMLIALWAVFGALVGGGLGGLVGGIVLSCIGQPSVGIVMLAGGFVCAGLAILAFLGCKGATTGLLLLTKKGVRWGKARLTKKEGTK